MNILLPDVSKKNGFVPFDPAKIFNSLRRETSLTFSQAHVVREEVVRLIVSMNLRFLSGPLIREIVNVVLLQHGFEKERLEYTRIGFPFHDLNNLYLKYYKYSKDKFIYLISNHIKKEYEAVKKLIEEREK